MARKTKSTSGNMLTDLFRDMIKTQNLGREKNYIETYSTGIDLLDYHNGKIDEGDINVGINGGKIITVIGKSGTGKSTMALQIASNIVKNYENGQIIHLDYENATEIARFKSLSKWSNETIKEKYIHLNEGIYSESAYEMIKAVSNKKLEYYDQLKIKTGKVDDEGEEIYILPPTIVLIDSWALMIPREISNEKELSGSMSASAIAKTNNSVIKRIVGPIKEANIIVIVVNHITQKIEIGPIKTSNSLNYLGQDETVPGGSSCIYLADNIIKLQASSKLEQDKDFGIKGFYVTCQYLKSRSNSSGYKFELVFNQEKGFDNFYTNFNYLKKLKILKGNGRAYYFEFDPNTKFTQKNVKELYLKDKHWAEKFDSLVKEYYAGLLNSSADFGNQQEVDEEEIQLIECVDEEKDIWKGSDDNYYKPDSNGDYVQTDYIVVDMD